jgi:hypothetical protein
MHKKMCDEVKVLTEQ